VSLDSYLRAEARQDLVEAARWYEERRAGLGSEFLDAFLVEIDRLEQNPETNPRVDVEVRRALLRRFPYGIYYVVESDFIEILAIRHLRRQPGAWKKRVKSPRA
jgi:plasmid stabilization system protein ParE